MTKRKPCPVCAAAEMIGIELQLFEIERELVRRGAFTADQFDSPAERLERLARFYPEEES